MTAPTVVWLSNETPAADGGGGQRRQFHQIKALTQSGIPVHVVTLAGDQDDASIRAIAPITRFTVSRSDRLLRRPSRQLGTILADVGPGAAVVAHVESVPLAEPHLTERRIPWALDFQNVNSRWFAIRQQPHEAAEWRAQERAALSQSDLSTCCSEQEREALVALSTETRIEVAPNGVDPAEWPGSAIAERREPVVAVFATWSHAPNRIGLEWFYGTVWPAIVAARPGATLLIAGPGTPPPAPSGLPGVEIVGRVKNLAHFLGNVRIIAVPITQGIGARMKFGEALASGAAVVSTSTGAEGAGRGAHFVTADSSEDFARACIGLLADGDRAAALGQAGREWSLENLAWSRTTSPIIRWCAGAITPRAPGGPA